MSTGALPELAEYHRRRRFHVTPEPAGGARRRRSGHTFVVQKHAATRLHYDFRLELDGVLKSWAVPKGPSYDPAEKRLAVQTEDHPLEYGGFEGIIPEGEYGAGTVIVWDRGSWDPPEDAAAALARGHLKFRLHGEKLVGGWALVRIRGRERREAGKNWLLVKERDEYARPGYDVTAERPESVLRDDPPPGTARVWHSNRPARRRQASRPQAVRAAAVPDPSGVAGARRRALPARPELQLATLVDAPPAGDDWLHEIKYDGYRIACRLEHGAIRLLSRNGIDWTERLGALARRLSLLPVRAALLDGEVAVLMPDGTTSFNALQNALSGTRAPNLVYMAFDLLHLDGWDLTGAALEDRKAVLRALVEAAGIEPCRYSDHVRGGGAEFLRHACRLGLEGIVSKRRDAPYTPGRGRSWLKIKCVHEQEFVIGGFTDPAGRRAGIGALLVGVNEAGRLVYAGKVGTGFTDATARALRARLDALESDRCPFAERPAGVAGAHWVRPELVAEVGFSEWTPDGRLRHPSFKGLRDDKPAASVVRERPTSAARAARAAADDPPEVEVAGVRLTHADRVVYPALGLTKLDVARFYEAIAEWVVPQLRDRPTTLVRCPDGLDGGCFYQKHVGYWAPPTLRRVRIRERRKSGEYLVVDDLPGLIGLVQIGILEIHTWNSRTAHLEQPDRLVFDLDPGPDVPWRAVVAAARLIRARLRAVGLESLVKTTGGKGLHVVVPLVIGPGWDACAAFARAFATTLAREVPEAFTATMAKRARAGRIFIDYLRNLRGATAVAAYSTRARPEAPVSTPLAWDELDVRHDSAHYTVLNLPRRLAALRDDPWGDYEQLRRPLPAKEGP
ncbi:MAG TPA: DNA ligase D [Candidatus Limnocylindria bacterium]|nr:DNA ligase D [Candidatus Limnocylindria bacterium]